VGPRVGLDDVEKRKFLTLPGTRTSNFSVVQPVASRYTDYAIPAHKCTINEVRNINTFLRKIQTIFLHNARGACI
jgi:hypothetical protein